MKVRIMRVPSGLRAGGAAGRGHAAEDARGEEAQEVQEDVPADEDADHVAEERQELEGVVDVNLLDPRCR